MIYRDAVALPRDMTHAVVKLLWGLSLPELPSVRGTQTDGWTRSLLFSSLMESSFISFGFIKEKASECLLVSTASGKPNIENLFSRFHVTPIQPFSNIVNCHGHAQN